MKFYIISSLVYEPGRALSSLIISRLRLAMEILSELIRRANMTRDMNWLVYALVEATPISGPAFMWIPQLVSLLIELPTVFVTPTHKAPLFLQYLKAFNVSAVSPKNNYNSVAVINTEAKRNFATHSDLSVETTDPKRHLEPRLEM